MLYRWIKMFNKHKGIWLGAVNNAAATSKVFLDDIADMVSFSDFTSGFFSQKNFSYLQNHANPACSVRGG
jgi:hypothetical protein